MMKFDLKIAADCILLPRFAEIDEVYRQLDDQKEETCGLYGLSYLLRGLGWLKHGQHTIDENYLAYLGRANLSVDEYRRNEEINDLVKNGSLTVDEAEEKYGRIWYRYRLPFSEVDSELGTSAEGVKLACETATEGQVIAVPVPSRCGATIFFDPFRFDRLLSSILKNASDWDAQVILNYRTDRLLDPNHSRYTLGNILAHSDDAAYFELDRWSVGHFVTMAGAIRFAPETCWIVIRDTYKNKGFKGYHLQPVERLRQALVRDDGREGGVMIIVPRSRAAEVEESVRQIGLELAVWDNGSPCRR